jgi:hypothetical protein
LQPVAKATTSDVKRPRKNINRICNPPLERSEKIHRWIWSRKN